MEVEFEISLFRLLCPGRYRPAGCRPKLKTVSVRVYITSSTFSKIAHSPNVCRARLSASIIFHAAERSRATANENYSNWIQVYLLACKTRARFLRCSWIRAFNGDEVAESRCIFYPRRDLSRWRMCCNVHSWFHDFERYDSFKYAELKLCVSLFSLQFFINFYYFIILLLYYFIILLYFPT